MGGRSIKLGFRNVNSNLVRGTEFDHNGKQRLSITVRTPGDRSGDRAATAKLGGEHIARKCSLPGQFWRRASMTKNLAAAAKTADKIAQPIEIDKNHRRRVERQRLAQDEAAAHGIAKRVVHSTRRRSIAVNAFAKARHNYRRTPISDRKGSSLRQHHRGP